MREYLGKEDVAEGEQPISGHHSTKRGIRELCVNYNDINHICHHIIVIKRIILSRLKSKAMKRQP
ncbi:hypothetical protein DPMN_019954 [Dreissena polymorpha]|uniref:Uncharacterized protein n=1 Tax=Dreissena polymorpha TaxID=45954 RepID=A0A9D4FKH9_DREPO|nr:hypothetical protein DPMN_151088 [Dreissena polymorpha]KAH3895788.1 hypothetical protein DPMN_019954 [Dreissena polymorpha]